MKILDSLLKTEAHERSVFEIILWWEIRRILYNFIVLVSGVLSLIIMIKSASGIVVLEPGEDFYEPIMILIFGIVCNLAYTLGWLIEIIFKPGNSYAPKMFKRGLYFTLFWVFLPSTIWLIIGIISQIKKIF